VIQKWFISAFNFLKVSKSLILISLQKTKRIPDWPMILVFPRQNFLFLHTQNILEDCNACARKKTGRNTSFQFESGQNYFAYKKSLHIPGRVFNDFRNRWV